MLCRSLRCDLRCPRNGRHTSRSFRCDVVWWIRSIRLLRHEACSPILVSTQSACQEEPVQLEAFDGFCGSNSDARITPALRRSWLPQHAYPSSLRLADSVPLSPIKLALPLIPFSDWGRVSVQSTLSAAHAPYAARFSPLVESLVCKKGGTCYDLPKSGGVDRMQRKKAFGL
jgi:hypothetical protein